MLLAICQKKLAIFAQMATILGPALSNNLSASDHIRRVVSESAQTLYALRVLRHHGMSEVGLQKVFRAVLVSRPTYASTAWGGFITATDIQRFDAFLRRSKRCGFCPPDLPDFGEQLAEYDDRLFNRIRHNRSTSCKPSATAFCGLPELSSTTTKA